MTIMIECKKCDNRFAPLAGYDFPEGELTSLVTTHSYACTLAHNVRAYLTGLQPGPYRVLRIAGKINESHIKVQPIAHQSLLWTVKTEFTAISSKRMIVDTAVTILRDGHAIVGYTRDDAADLFRDRPSCSKVVEPYLYKSLLSAAHQSTINEIGERAFIDRLTKGT